MAIPTQLLQVYDKIYDLITGFTFIAYALLSSQLNLVYFLEMFFVDNFSLTMTSINLLYFFK